MVTAPQARSITTVESNWHPIQEDHRALGIYAERLDRLLSGIAKGTQSAGVEVPQRLEEFRRLLVAHLAAEERSGILERAAAAEPRLSRRIEQLRFEHDELRQGVDALAAGPDSAGVRTDWAEFHARFVDFRAGLELHEDAENDILYRAYLEDIGGRG